MQHLQQPDKFSSPNGAGFGAGRQWQLTAYLFLKPPFRFPLQSGHCRGGEALRRNDAFPRVLAGHVPRFWVGDTPPLPARKHEGGGVFRVKARG